MLSLYDCYGDYRASLLLVRRRKARQAASELTPQTPHDANVYTHNASAHWALRGRWAGGRTVNKPIT